MCTGYIMGAIDGYNDQQERINTLLGTDTTRMYCVPTQVTVKQLIDTVVLYLQQHPERRHYAAIDEVSIALTEAYPCNN